MLSQPNFGFYTTLDALDRVQMVLFLSREAIHELVEFSLSHNTLVGFLPSSLILVVE